MLNSFVTPWTVACQAPLSMAFPRQEYWSGLPFPSLRDLPDPGIEAASPTLQADSLPLKPQARKIWSAKRLSNIRYYGSSHMALTLQFRVLIFKVFYFSLILLTQINDI